MRAAILMTLAVVIPATGIFGGPANAFPPAAPSANKTSGIVTQVAAVCGATGCSTVMTKKVRHYGKQTTSGPGQRI
jgi:hypothetical protein